MCFLARTPGCSVLVTVDWCALSLTYPSDSRPCNLGMGHHGKGAASSVKEHVLATIDILIVATGSGIDLGTMCRCRGYPGP